MVENYKRIGYSFNWLASPGVNGNGSNANFGLGVVANLNGMTMATTLSNAFDSLGTERPYSGYAGIRPVVILKSNINKDQIQKVTE